MDALTFALAALSTARITRLITADKITEPIRVALMRRLNPEGNLAYLIACDWCASIYVGAGVAAIWHQWGDAWVFELVALALSASYVAGFLNSRVED